MVLAAATAGKLLGADAFHAYPTVHLGLEPSTAAVAAVVLLAGLVPFRRV